MKTNDRAALLLLTLISVGCADTLAPERTPGGPLSPGAQPNRNQMTLSPNGTLLGSGAGTATIDGTLSSGEWAGAAWHDVPVMHVGAPTVTGRVHIMNDGQYLYTALEIPSAQPSYQYTFGLRAGQDTWFVRVTNHGASVTLNDDYFATSFSQTADVNLGGAQHLDGAFGFDGTKVVIEMSHPLNSGDGYDIAAAAGDVISISHIGGLVGTTSDWVVWRLVGEHATGAPQLDYTVAADTSGHRIELLCPPRLSGCNLYLYPKPWLIRPWFTKVRLTFPTLFDDRYPLLLVRFDVDRDGRIGPGDDVKLVDATRGELGLRGTDFTWLGEADCVPLERCMVPDDELGGSFEGEGLYQRLDTEEHLLELLVPYTSEDGLDVQMALGEEVRFDVHVLVQGKEGLETLIAAPGEGELHRVWLEDAR